MQSIDGLLTYRQADAIAYARSLELHPHIWWGQWLSTSKFGIGLSLLYLPGVVLFAGLSHLVPLQHGPVYDFRLLYADPVYVLAAEPIQIFATLATAILVALTIRHFGFGHRSALLGMGLYGIGSPAIVYVRSDFTQPLTALCWMAGIYAALRFRSTGRLAPLVAAAILVFYAVLTRPVEGTLLLLGVGVLVAPSLAFWRWRLREWRSIGVLGAGYAAAIVVTLLVDWGRFGSPFTTGYEGTGWTTPLPIGLAGALVSPGRGLLWQFPALVLAPLGARRLVRDGSATAVLAITGLVLAELLNVSAWESWWGGWDWGLRLFLPALPLLAVLACAGANELPRRFLPWLPATLFGLGVIWAVPAVLTDLLAGYASAYDGTAQNFSLLAYPPLGAWRFLHHLRASSIADSAALDIVWLRLAYATHNLSLLPGAIFAIAAVLLTRRVVRLERASSEN